MISTQTMQQLSGFYLPWTAALTAAAAEGPATPGLVLRFEGLELPVLQLALAVAGVLMARPLAPRRETERGWLRQLCVTAIMLIVAIAWVGEAQPGVLFTFVVSIGLGFSGYALVELAGREIENVIKRIFAQAAEMVGRMGPRDRENDP